MTFYKPSILIGKQITAHSPLLAAALSWDTDGGPVEWAVEGDCCSYGVFTDVVGNPTAIGRVVAVDDLAMTDERINPAKLSKQPEHQECEQVYGIVVRGESGECVVVHRNWSNGYYGNDFTEAAAPPREGGGT